VFRKDLARDGCSLDGHGRIVPTSTNALATLPLEQLRDGVAAGHEEETSGLVQELERAKTRAAAAEARAEAGDRRAATAEAAAREAAEHAARSEAVASDLRVDVATAHAAAESATQRGDGAERLLEQAHAELQTERHRHDVSLAQLHDQLAELIARRPARRPAKKTSPRKRAATASQPVSPTAEY
jgi:chromosome segregation ATPase